ncbi:MAG TPA: PilZ domain-containing protein [Hyphomicrobiaceae bacterium]|nr:PilZ domain-containing protein [Hyphomicrobiaceae bacterium]
MSQEHRTNQRHRTLKTGKITFGNGACVIDCVIRNMSDAGASLIVPTTVGIPGKFILVDVHGGSEHPVHIAWRQGERMGVHFDDVPVPAPLRERESVLPRAQPKLVARASIHPHALGTAA